MLLVSPHTCAMSESSPTQGLRHGVAEEVRVLLARRHMSAAELARQIGWSQTYMARRMLGVYAFNLDDLEAIAKSLDVGVADLLPKGRGEVTLTFPPVPDMPELRGFSNGSASLAQRTAPSMDAPWPDHPLVASAVSLHALHPAGGPPPSPTRTAPTGR